MSRVRRVVVVLAALAALGAAQQTQLQAAKVAASAEEGWTCAAICLLGTAACCYLSPANCAGFCRTTLGSPGCKLACELIIDDFFDGGCADPEGGGGGDGEECPDPEPN